MEPLGRNVRMVARPGRREALLTRLLAVAAGLREAPGCLLYLISRDSEDEDAIWVSELWRSRADLEAALKSEGAEQAMPGVLELVDRERTERIDLEPVGGVGYPPAERGFEIVHLPDLEDMAARFGFGELGEARFARGSLGAARVGLSLQRLHPYKRQGFGHRHHADEEIYVILEGNGQIAVDDRVAPVRALDAIRVPPGSTRAFEAGPEGLSWVATGLHHAGDAEMVPGFWA